MAGASPANRCPLVAVAHSKADSPDPVSLRRLLPFRRAAPFLRSGRSWARRQMAGSGGFATVRCAAARLKTRRSSRGAFWPCAVWPLWSKRHWEAAVRGHLSRTAGINPPVAEIPTLARRFSRQPVTFSRQFFEQRLCFFQIGRREALGEPSINLCQQRVRFFAPSLVAPQPGKARGGAQFPG
jgi:hypothetical protein